ncbi:hypothetical protein KAX97_14645 [candidate division WOR-3 bacterium]|jgi:hypothetical protein|nr:hypothetical protein [candidate division WOR-3 bacterium]
MVEILGQTIGFWSAFIAGILILLHIPSCNKHWAYRLKPFSNYLGKVHDETLIIATIFAILHIVSSLLGLAFNIWI